jgi:hypothetical protein
VLVAWSLQCNHLLAANYASSSSGLLSAGNGAGTIMLACWQVLLTLLWIAVLCFQQYWEASLR